MSLPIVRLLIVTIGCSATVLAQGTPETQQPSAEAAWRARRAADSVCATYPITGSATTRGLLVRRNPVTGDECRKSRLPTLAAFVLTDHLICPSATPWNDPNPLTLISRDRVARIEVKRDSLTFAEWRCPSPVDAVIFVVAKPRSGS